MERRGGVTKAKRKCSAASTKFLVAFIKEIWGESDRPQINVTFIFACAPKRCNGAGNNVSVLVVGVADTVRVNALKFGRIV